MSKHANNDLKKIAWELRINTFHSLYAAQSGHVGPCLSMAEILTCLFFKHMNINKNKINNDKFILSKGHGVPILYCVYAMLGWIKNDELMTLRQIDSRLQGHPDRVSLDLLDAGTGALGQGLSISIGYSIAANLEKSNARSYCIIGDGELQEGQIWEGLLFAGVKQMGNLCLILDNNKFQNEVSVKETLGSISYEDKFKAFGWNYISVDGHSIEEVSDALLDSNDSILPTVIDAQTIKGKGVSFMENDNSWHSKVLDEASYRNAIKECKAAINEIN